MMITFLIVIIILAIVIYLGYRYRTWVANQLRRSSFGGDILSWIHSTIFDFKMEDPGEIPKQITFMFIGLVIIIGVVAILIASSNQ